MKNEKVYEYVRKLVKAGKGDAEFNLNDFHKFLGVIDYGETKKEQVGKAGNATSDSAKKPIEDSIPIQTRQNIPAPITTSKTETK